MRAEDLIQVSVDNQVVEPRDTVEEHVPARWRDGAPRMVAGDDGRWQGALSSPSQRRRRSVGPRPVPEEFLLRTLTARPGALP